MPVRIKFPFAESLIQPKIISSSLRPKKGTTRPNKIPMTIGVSLVLVMLITGCGESKISQCNQLIEMVNETEQTLGNITQSSPPDINALQDIADATNQAGTELKAISLRNNKLNQFKSRFLEFYSKISEDAQTIVNAHEEQNMPDAEAAYKRLEATFETQEPLVNDINAFCSENYNE